MLRGLTATQFLEWQAYEALEPFGEAGLDRRFALLAAVIAGSAGATTRDGKPYSAATFLAALHGDDASPAPPTRPQTVAQMEAAVMKWTETANAARSGRGAR